MLTMEMFGNLEDAENDETRMIVRVLGQRIGTSDGWLHIGGHAVLCPGFRREAGLLSFMKDQDIPNKSAVVMDYYTGYMAIIEEPDVQPKNIGDLKIIWSTTLIGKTK